LKKLSGKKEIKVMYNLIIAAKDTPHCNACLTLIRGGGVEAERHGESMEVIKSSSRKFQ